MRELISIRGVDVIIIHETNGRKYFEALAELQRRGVIASLTIVETSVIWKFGHSLLRERRNLGSALAQAWRNLRFRFTSHRLHGKVILLGLAPWDARFLFYAPLRRRNHLIYHTSWPRWAGFEVPNPGGIAGPYLRRKWLSILRDPNVDAVAVISVAATSLAQQIEGKLPTVIPHVVSDAFFSQSAAYRKPFRLLFVGELVENRGLRRLADVLSGLDGEAVVLDIVGDGPQRELASALALRSGGRWHRHIRDRSALAQLMASCQLLVSPSVKTARWEELFGMAIVEAMASGLPCIVSDHVGPRSIIEDGVSGILIADDSPATVVKAIKQLLRDEAAWSRMSAAARQRAEGFRLTEVAARWEGVIASGVRELAERRLLEGSAKPTASGPRRLLS